MLNKGFKNYDQRDFEYESGVLMLFRGLYSAQNMRNIPSRLKSQCLVG
jgi:hypothetical protein